MNVRINIPQDLYDQARNIAEVHKVSVEQVLESALADQLAAWERLRQRAAQGDCYKFLAVLDNLSEIEPEE
jgi:hypothetical protein